jgi:hypothetical protein
MRILTRSLLIGGFIAVIATALLRLFPDRNTYLHIPGYVLAFLINGGEHQRVIGDVGWYVIPPIGNFLFYSLLVYAFLGSRRKVPNKARAVGDSNA